MNRILFSAGELAGDGAVRLSGRRAGHILSVLKPSVGDSLRIGMLDGVTGLADVSVVGDDYVDLSCTLDAAAPPRPCVSLLLALPRPKVMKRLWSPLAMLGVHRILLSNAEKVERNYFDTHWLQESNYRPLLVQGLEQSGDTHVPRVSVHRRLKPLIEDQLDDMVPAGARLLAHPGQRPDLTGIPGNSAEHVLLAVGPEGGWTPYEQDMLGKHGFVPVSLGRRRLRTDIACTALLSVLHASFDGGHGRGDQ